MKKLICSMIFMLFSVSVCASSVEEIPNGAFMQCESAEYISLPQTVKSIGDEAFLDCKNLKVINLALETTSIGNNAFKGCTSLSRAVIFNNVDSIGDTAFEDCGNLTIFCYEGSYAEDYALENDIDVYYLDNLGVYGDANGDGTVSASDALVVLQYSLNSDNSDIEKMIADVNADDNITASDALNILQKSLNSDYEFIVEK